MGRGGARFLRRHNGERSCWGAGTAVAHGMHCFRIGLIAVLGFVACLEQVRAVGAAEPSLHLEGKGTLATFQPCTPTSCPAVLTATLDGVPYGQTTFNMPISISPEPNEFTGCRPAFSNGGKLNRGQYMFTFTGEYCESPIKGLFTFPFPSVTPPVPTPSTKARFPAYSICGTVQIHIARTLCVGVDMPAAVGTLTVFGDLNGDSSLVSIIGTANSIPLCPRPSP